MGCLSAQNLPVLPLMDITTTTDENNILELHDWWYLIRNLSPQREYQQSIFMSVVDKAIFLYHPIITIAVTPGMSFGIVWYAHFQFQINGYPSDTPYLSSPDVWTCRNWQHGWHQKGTTAKTCAALVRGLSSFSSEITVIDVINAHASINAHPPPH